MPDITALIPHLLTLCHRAGTAICGHYHAPGAVQVEAKQDDSPLTRADIDSHELLRDGLRQLGSGLPVLSEESTPEHKARRHEWPRYWLVDPLDGTKEFVAGTGEFTINVALIDEHRPVLGLLYLPLKACAYVGVPGHFARCYTLDSSNSWQAREIHTRSPQPGQALTVLASRRHRGRLLAECLGWLGEHWGELERENSGSALKFCQLALGDGDFYPRFSPCCEWDVAAGQALVEAAGGAVLGLDGQALRYNCSDSLMSPHFLALGDPQLPLWQDLLRALPALGRA